MIDQRTDATFLDMLCCFEAVSVTHGSVTDRYRLCDGNLQHFISQDLWDITPQPFHVISHIMRKKGYYADVVIAPYVESGVAQK
jgi:hypothetical protein